MLSNRIMQQYSSSENLVYCAQHINYLINPDDPTRKKLIMIYVSLKDLVDSGTLVKSGQRGGFLYHLPNTKLKRNEVKKELSTKIRKCVLSYKYGTSAEVVSETLGVSIFITETILFQLCTIQKLKRYGDTYLAADGDQLKLVENELWHKVFKKSIESHESSDNDEFVETYTITDMCDLSGISKDLVEHCVDSLLLQSRICRKRPKIYDGEPYLRYAYGFSMYELNCYRLGI